MKHLSLATIALASFAAIASSDSVECRNSTGTIKFGAGNAGQTITVKYKTKTGEAKVFKGDVSLLPDYAGLASDTALNVLVVGKPKTISTEHQIQHVYDVHGKLKCTGRESWDDRYTQTMVITAKDNGTLFQTFDYDSKVPNMNTSGYISGVFTCRAYGVTTAGGCFVDDNETIRWIDERP